MTTVPSSVALTRLVVTNWPLFWPCSVQTLSSPKPTSVSLPLPPMTRSIVATASPKLTVTATDTLL